MKIKATDICFLIAFSLVFGPLIFDVQMNPWLYYVMCLVGVVLAAIGGYNAQAGMVGLGEPGEDLLQSWWKVIKRWLGKN